MTAVCPLGKMVHRRLINGYSYHHDGDHHHNHHDYDYDHHDHHNHHHYDNNQYDNDNATFARVASTGEAPKVLCAVVAVDWGLVALLHEAGDVDDDNDGYDDDYIFNSFNPHHDDHHHG